MKVKKETTRTTVYGSSKTAVLVVWGEDKEKKAKIFAAFISVIDVLPKWVLAG